MTDQEEAEKVVNRLHHAIDSMKGKLTERPMPDADRCILCGWVRIDTERGGSCGRDKHGQHLWFTQVAQALTKARQEHHYCSSEKRCIICSECEAKIVERATKIAGEEAVRIAEFEHSVGTNAIGIAKDLRHHFNIPEGSR